MKSIYTLVLTIFSFSLLAQSHPTCDDMRYRTEVFEEFEVVTGVQFGQGLTIGGAEKDLLMDIYYPIDDNATSRQQLCWHLEVVLLQVTVSLWASFVRLTLVEVSLLSLLTIDYMIYH